MSVFTAGLKRIDSELPNGRVLLCGVQPAKPDVRIAGEPGENWDPAEANAIREPRDGMGESLLGVLGGINRRE